MKPVDLKSKSFVEYNEESNEKDPKFKFGDYVRISNYKNVFAKGYSPNWSEEIFVIKVKNGPMSLLILMVRKIVGSFYEKELQRTNQK